MKRDNTQKKEFEQTQHEAAASMSPETRAMADLTSCEESLKVVKKLHRPSLFKVFEQLGKVSD